jgi:menaquinone-dependent protoporphyrinogen IX oxidase
MLTASGHRAEARPVAAAADLAGCEAFVIGSAVYYACSSAPWIMPGSD